MRILLIVGNGFDLNLGLPTSYRHFYKYYLEHTESRNEHVKKLKSIIKDDIENWSDLELKLGEVTEQFTSPNHFITAFSHLKRHLTSYLKTVNNFDIPQLNTIADIFAKDLIGYKKYFDPKYEKLCNEYTHNYISENADIVDIMSFNYTDTLERITDCVSNNIKLIDKIEIDNIYHIHNILDYKGIILGVNDENQILNKSLAVHPDIKATIVKPYINKEYASDIDGECFRAIMRADIIFIFGLSLGVTDKIWWNYIGNQVANNKKRIIYCPYEKDNKQLDISEIIRRNSGLMNHCANSMYLTNNERAAVTQKIYPIRANQMFNFGVSGNIEANHEVVIEQLTTKINATV